MKLRVAVRMLAMLLGIAIGIAGLIAAGHNTSLAIPDDWSQGSSISHAFVIVRLAALAIGVWLFIGTFITGALALLGNTASARRTARFLPKPMRSVAAGFATVGLTFSAASNFVQTSEAEVAYNHAPAPPMLGLDELRTAPTMISEPIVQVEAVQVEREDTWEVKAGDHFWSIAKTTLENLSDTVPTEKQINAYWKRVVETNRSNLRDPENPDLIYPGQIMKLPSL